MRLFRVQSGLRRSIFIIHLHVYVQAWIRFVFLERPAFHHVYKFLISTVSMFIRRENVLSLANTAWHQCRCKHVALRTKTASSDIAKRLTSTFHISANPSPCTVLIVFFY